MPLIQNLRSHNTFGDLLTVLNTTINVVNRLYTNVAGDISFAPTANVVSTNVQTAIEEVGDKITGNNTAIGISFTPTANVVSNNVQTAIVEVGDRVAGNNAASGISFVPTANVVSTNVQTAIAEIGNKANSIFRSIGFVVFNSDEAVTVGNGTEGFVVSPIINNMILSNAVASVYTKGITGTTDIQIRKRTTNLEYNMLSTMITIGDEYSAMDGISNTTTHRVATGDILFVDVANVHSGTAPNGLSVTVTFAQG